MKIVRLYRFSFLLLLLIEPFFCINARAQQDSQYTQYIYNTMSVNPAYTGSRGRLSVLALYRNQWVGFPGAPKTLNLSASSPVGESRQVGLGVEFINDELGPSVFNKVAANFSYVIPFEAGFYMAFGLKGGFTTLSIDPTKLNIYDPNGLNLDVSDHFMPVLGVGAYFYTHKWFVGISTPNLLETKVYNDMQVSVARRKMHLYFIGGYLFKLNDQVNLKPAALVKAVSGGPLSVDVSLNTILYQRLALGVNYRFSASVSGMAGFKINDNILVGYAYDYATTALSHYNNGTHEIFIRFELNPPIKTKGVSPFF